MRNQNKLQHLLFCSLIFFSGLFLFSSAQAQYSENFNDLKQYIIRQPKINVDSSEFLSIYHNHSLHYLYPLYKAFHQDKWLKTSPENAPYLQELSEAVSFTGDYATSLSLEKSTYAQPISDSVQKELKSIVRELSVTELRDAKKFVLEKSRDQKVVMINESHNKPQHRAFIAGLLEGFYQLGFRYLAMETLNEFGNASLKKLNMLTGHYTCEPVAGEMIRQALAIGFVLVPYEDSINGHSVQQREYTQASHLQELMKKDPQARILVVGGAEHLEEASATADRIPMAAYFKILTGIDPLTIDQATMTEGSTGRYGNFIYEQFSKTNPFNTPVIAYQQGKSRDPFGINLNDIYIFHPPTRYKNGRPTWMSMNGLKKETGITPAYQNLFFVQAYYDREYQEKFLGQLVPADQTYITDQDGYYHLYLQPGKYRLVFRDKQYSMLGSKPLVVE